MILFKRVGESFGRIEGREWALLFLETLGVVAGILVAFWLNEWASRRDTSAKHHEMMERLLEENENDISVLRDWRDSLKGMVEKEQAFAVKLSHDQCPPSAEFEAVSTMPLLPAMTAPRSVHDELMSAGGLSSIERQDVRDQIAIFYGDLEWGQHQIDYFRQARVKPIDESDPRMRIRFDPTRAEPQVDEYDGTALCRDQGFKNRVAAATRAHTVYVGYFAATVQSAISMCVRVADSLGKTCNPKLGGPLKGDDAVWREKAIAAMRKDLAKN